MELTDLIEKLGKTGAEVSQSFVSPEDLRGFCDEDDLPPFGTYKLSIDKRQVSLNVVLYVNSDVNTKISPKDNLHSISDKIMKNSFELYTSQPDRAEFSINQDCCSVKCPSLGFYDGMPAEKACERIIYLFKKND